MSGGADMDVEGFRMNVCLTLPDVELVMEALADSKDADAPELLERFANSYVDWHPKGVVPKPRKRRTKT